jgi:hypothetical protein
MYLHFNVNTQIFILNAICMLQLHIPYDHLNYKLQLAVNFQFGWHY